jgi:primosomal protein N' (replication factor Y)
LSECGNVDLVPLGHGTQRLERALGARFPNARIERIDRDSTRRKGAFSGVRDRVHAGEIDILVGTQMLAKGHDFPRLTLVGVVGADNALYSGDFRATERLAALLFQVSGRAGRADLPGEVIVQTDFPTHPLARALAAHDYERFAEVLLAERRAATLPPFAHLAMLVAEARTRDLVDAFLAAASEAGRRAACAESNSVEVFPSVPASMPRRAGLERGQVVAHAIERSAMQRFLPHWRSAIETLPGRRVRWGLDVDPLGFA